MKLYVIALLGLVTSSVGADDSKLCTVTLEEGEDMHDKMAAMAMRCLATDMAMIERIKGTDTLEGHKSLFKDMYCDKKEQLRACWNDVAHKSEVCQSETRHKFFMLFRDLLENVLESGCVQDGEIVAGMFMNYNFSDTPAFELDAFHECMHNALVSIVRLMDKHIEPHSRFFILYREAVESKECFGKIQEGDVDLMKKIESVVGDIANKMKCMHTQEDTAVLCKTIDVNLPDVPRICPLKTQDGRKETMMMTLLEGISWCLRSSFTDVDGLKAIDTLERSWQFFVHNCEKKEEIKKCLAEVVTLSSVCLDEVQHMTLKLTDDLLRHGMDSLCIADGGYPAGYVTYKALSKEGATVGNNAITECKNIAHPHPEESETHRTDAAHFLTLYHDLKTFKECLMNRMHGDNRAVFDVHLFLSSLERKMKCLDPDHGTMVLCETIDTTPSTAVTVCPFVGRSDGEPLDFFRLVDMSILCLKASTLNLDRPKKFTTLQEFQTFFVDFCHNRQAVQRCFDDVTAYSEVCLNQTNRHMLNIFNGAFGDALTFGCKQNGEILAIISNGVIVGGEHAITNEMLDTCISTHADQLTAQAARNDTLAKQSAMFYHQYVSFTECILKHSSDAGTFKTVLSTFTNELRKVIKCIRPEDGNLVLCDTLSDTNSN